MKKRAEKNTSAYMSLMYGREWHTQIETPVKNLDVWEIAEEHFPDDPDLVECAQSENYWDGTIELDETEFYICSEFDCSYDGYGVVFLIEK